MFQQTVAQRDTIQQEPGAPVHLSSKTKETDTPFPFMKLPIELRRQVYRQLLVSDEDYLGMNFPGNTLYPNILQTCHQVHSEGAEVLYGENVFSIIVINRSSPYMSWVRRTTTGVFKTDETHLTRFLKDHPNITHLFLNLDDNINETEEIHIAIEDSLQAHNGLVKLKVRLYLFTSSLTQKSIDFLWRLHSIIRRNRVAISGVTVRPEEVELYDTAACPYFASIVPDSELSIMLYGTVGDMFD